MYSIYADGICIYSDTFLTENTKAVNPKLVLEDNGAGSLSLTLTPANAGYEAISRLVSSIVVYKDGSELWDGRVLSEKTDFWNNRTLYCEGALAFFNDSIQPPAEYRGQTVRQYLQALIEVHNSKVNANRRFTLGVVTVNDADFPVYYTNYEKTMKILNDLIERYGGHMRVRRENGVRYLDYLAEYPNVCDQTIRFGTNLLEFTRQWDMTDFATVIVPLGARLDDSEIEALDAYLTVKDVNDGNIFVQSENAVATYGWIEKTITWDDITDAETLLTKAQAYLSDIQFDNMVLELSALDMHYLNVSVESVKLLDEIRVTSIPHGLNHLFPVTKLEIPLDSPEKTQFTLGTTVRTSLTGVNNQTNNQILSKIDNLSKAHSILKEARENAASIMNLATNGYITITKDSTGSEALIISNEKNYLLADRYWKWNANGLAYYKASSGSVNLPIAITMDGSIVADFITAGTMSANRVRAGTLESTNKNVIFNLDDGTLTMKSGSIQLGEYSNGHYQFEVDNYGHLYAGSNAIFAGQLSAATGSFGGSLTGATGSFSGTVTAQDFINSVTGESMLDASKKKILSNYLELDSLYVTIDDLETKAFARINALPNEIMAQVSSTYVSNDGLEQRLSTSVTLNANGVLISNATGKAFKIDTANNISISFGNLTDATSKQNEINNAQNTADNAQSAANTAQGAANAAQSTANSAQSAASAAQSTANNAQNTALSALSTADSVNSALSALQNNIGYTYIDGQFVISPTIVGGTFYAASNKNEYLQITSSGLKYFKYYSGAALEDWSIETSNSVVRFASTIYPISIGSIYGLTLGTSGNIKFQADTADFTRVSNVTGLYLRFTS